MSLSSNAGKLARQYQQRAKRMRAAIKRGLRNIAIQVDNFQVVNLSGSGAPGSYPVPVRTGNLRSNHFFRTVNHRLAIIGNTASYAAAVHESRPYLQNAADKVFNSGRHMDLMGAQVNRALT